MPATRPIRIKIVRPGTLNIAANVYPERMRAIVIRHYKTRSNESGRLMGWEDSPRGREWKADFDFVSSRLHERDIAFDAIYSSDLDRSRQTAKMHARKLGIENVYDTPHLNEINYGKLQKMKKAWIRRFFPQHKTRADLIYPGGESFRQMQQRSVDFFSSLTSSHPAQTVLIVTHAGVIRGLISHFLGLDFGDHLEHRISFRYIGEFRFDGPDFQRYEELGDPSGFVEKGAIAPSIVSGDEIR